MANTIVVGAQWGDEGKGKIVDYLTEHSDVVVRAQGGSNAGHTVISGGQKHVLHLVPSGILWPTKLNVIGNGVVLDPIGLCEEIAKHRGNGVTITPKNLLISDCAHLAMPYHQGLDKAREVNRGARKIGTTGRGIGPSYADKVERMGLRGSALLDADALCAEVAERIALHNEFITAAGIPAVDAEALLPKLRAAALELAPHITNTVVALHQAKKAGKTILFEGAQGTYLDIDHGTYPFVTSSNTTSGGVCTGSGLSPRDIHRIVAVAKAYTTRVGSGPFITEQDEISDMLHNMGREFGATTGRPRRCGWLDLVLVRYACMVNGADELAITNLDGLDGLDEIQVCVAYELDGQRIEYPPSTIAEIERCKPIYETHQGWKQDISAAKSFADLPPLARAYLDRLASYCETPVKLLGVGPAREQTLEA